MTDAPDDPDREGEDAESDDELAGDVLELTIDETHAGDRIDATIAALSPALSRAQAQRLIEAGLVRIGDAVIAKANHRVHAGDAVEVIVPRPEPIELVPEDIPLSVLYEDADLIVIDKPAGLVVHPAPGHPRGTLVNALLHHCTDLGGIGGELRPGIVHRLDKDTSGAIVVAKTERAHAAAAIDRALVSVSHDGGDLLSL
jgi:23S rRNA pseudouridine1911/1915/1917 synthase